MADAVEKVGKTLEIALADALRELGATREEVTYEILGDPVKGMLNKGPLTQGLMGMLGIKPVKIRVTRKETTVATEPEEVIPTDTVSSSAKDDSADVASETEEQEEQKAVDSGIAFLQDIFSAMQIAVTVETNITESGHVCRLIGDDLGILIGKHGQTLDSLQYLANIVANRQLGKGRVRLILDVEDYRKRREETLCRLARHVAEKACRLRQDIRLEPMNRHERKIIHLTLQDNHRVTTFSDGEEPHRYVVVSPRRGRRI